jgi:hypothetical protein
MSALLSTPARHSWRVGVHIGRPRRGIPGGDGTLTLSRKTPPVKAWADRRRPRGRHGLADAAVLDTARIANLIGGERFCDASIGVAIDDGPFATILE